MNSMGLNEKKIKEKRVSLNSLEKVTRYMARKIREFENDENRGLKLQEYRAFGYLMGKLIDCYRVQYEMDIEKRLQRIETQLEGQ